MTRLSLLSRFVALLFGSFLAASLSASTPQPVAVPSPLVGPPATGGGDSWGPILSPDGRYVLFASTANNLALGSNGVYQPLVPPRVNVFLRDRTNGTTILVSVNASGAGGGNADSIPTALSTNGQFVLFESAASNLVTNDANNAIDVFLRDVVSNQTYLVSVATNGLSGSGASQSSAMTPDGRYVAFSSVASNLVSGDVNNVADIFVRDMVAGTTTLASPGATGGNTDSPMITPDGRYVAFLSTATGMVAGATTDGDVYVSDLVNLTTVCASAAARSKVGSEFFFNHAISDDGQYVAFESGSSSFSTGLVFRYNLVTSGLDILTSNAVTSESERMEFHNLDMTPDGRFVAYLASSLLNNSGVNLWDGVSNITTLVSPIATLSNSVCAMPAISSNGQYVVYFDSPRQAPPVKSPTNSGSHLYLWNSETGSNSVVDSDPGGQVSFDSFISRPSMTPDGRIIAFDAIDSNLGGDPLSSYYNIYLSDQTTNTIEVVSARQTNLPSATARALSIGANFSVSSNGQFVAYSSIANRLSEGATNYSGCIFVSDLLNGSTAVISLNTNGVPTTNGSSFNPVISANGRYVAFTSTADDLVTNTGTGLQNVYWRDTQMGITALVSVTTNGTAANANSYSPVIDATGRYVLFTSVANNLGRTDSGGLQPYLYFRDIQTGTTLQVPGTNLPSAMTPDGHYVAFGSQQVCIWDSQAQSLVYSNNAGLVLDIAISPDGNRLAYSAGNDFLLVDRALNTNRVIKPGAFSPYTPAGFQFSGDGRYLVFFTTTAIAPNDTNGVRDIYLYDFNANTNLLISQSAGGIVGNGQSDQPAISWDGRFVAYRSAASNLVAGASNGFVQIYLFDNQTGATTLAGVSAFTGLAANNRSVGPIFSADSTTLVFHSYASDLITNDFSGSGGIDVLNIAVHPLALLGTIQIGPGGTPVINWPAAAGANFNVLYKNNLTDPTWLPLPGAITIISNIGSITDPSPTSPQRFYRIGSY